MHRRAADDESDCLVLSYHYVRGRSEAFPRLPALDPTHFEAQVAALLRDRHSVDYASFLDAVEGRRPLPGRTFLLTFDDGLIDHYATVFPILRAHGIAGVFFVSAAGAEARPRVLNVQKAQLLLARMGGAAFGEEVRAGLAALGCPMVAAPPRAGMYRYDNPADVHVKHLLNYELPFEYADPLLETLFATHIGREDDCARGLYLNESMIREMSAAGMIFGFHTWNHRVLSRLSPDGQRAELEGGVEWIRSLTGQPSVPFCYPHGHAHAYNADTVRILGDTGYSSAFTAVRRAADPLRDGRFELPRFDTRDVPGGQAPAAGERRHAPARGAGSGARGAML
jgi:peptidoglycan/xylan/chitin deacetylase (PgdA/CDA1 family)